MARKAKAAKPEEAIVFPQRYYVVAADFSLKRPGFCKFLVEREDERCIVSRFEITSVDNKRLVKPHGELLDDILKAMAFFFPEEEKEIPVFYVREKAINGRGAMVEIGIFKVVGMADWFLWRIKQTWHEIFPVSVKKNVTGTGKADKVQVADCLKYYLGEHDYANDDESDAAAVAVAWLIQQGQMKTHEPHDPKTEPHEENPIS